MSGCWELGAAAGSRPHRCRVSWPVPSSPCADWRSFLLIQTLTRPDPLCDCHSISAILRRPVENKLLLWEDTYKTGVVSGIALLFLFLITFGGYSVVTLFSRILLLQMIAFFVAKRFSNEAPGYVLPAFRARRRLTPAKTIPLPHRTTF